MSEEWRGFSRDSTSPASDVINVDLTSTDDIPSQPYRELRANSDGVIKVDTLGGTGRLLNFLAGERRAVYVTKVWKTGTTATGIEGSF